MQEIITVSQLSAKVKRLVESGFGTLNVRGEISDLKRYESGHAYFNLKDSESVISAVCWRGTKCAEKLNNGLDVICVATKITTYQKHSKYQITVSDMQLAGQGALMKMLEELKKRLLNEGIFDSSNKKPLPYLPRVIGVVTSPSGAVIRDIYHRIFARFPVRIILWPTIVQGEGAAEQIVAAINGFNKDSDAFPKPNIIIVARGGGSFEDLMPFNDEAVVRAAAASNIPLISAIGHETDNPLIDFAADVRAPTPTAAAEMSVPVKDELMSKVLDLKNRLRSGLQRSLDVRENNLSNLIKRFPASWQVIDSVAQSLNYMFSTVNSKIDSFFDKKKYKVDAFWCKTPDTTLRQRIVKELRHRLEIVRKDALDKKISDFIRCRDLLNSLSYKKILERGFAIVSDAGGKIVTTIEQAMSCDKMRITFKDGSISATKIG
ncbi:MAG: exodeoxyribonuclease VII large subunit [Holosporales bacterium]|jgi:exodeoxyribonuclease VII large subunit|nr:exodeoxyribonuclease VII large subunit [Holosporales bacterium]